MTVNELQEKYKKVPIDLKKLKRWVCFNEKKIPINAINGKSAKCDDPMTWSNFNIAIMGCEKYQLKGIGFMLGDGIFGVDLDNHPNKTTGELELSREEFKKLADEFIGTLDSYSEASMSGEGVHIICAGKLPGTKRKTTCVEMYDGGRYFAFTGNVLHEKNVENREQEIIPLYEKYIGYEEETPEEEFVREKSDLDLSEQEIIDKAINSKGGEIFKLLYEGDIQGAYELCGDWKDDSHSSADQAFCNRLAFWCNGDIQKMDNIFRNSGLMRDKWDEKRGKDTYGNITLNTALRMVKTGYVIKNQPEIVIGKKETSTENIKVNNETGEIISFMPTMNIDDYGEPIFRVKNIFKRYPCNDTGNAEKFYDYFGDLFKYNTTDKIFMFWTGKTWIRDEKNIIRKYANKFIEICKQEITTLEKELIDTKSEGNDTTVLENYLKAYQKNLDRISNKAGKDAMLSEFQSIKDIPVKSDEFNKDDCLLNTESGVVDLRTGEIKEFDPNLKISKNTNIPVSYETPVNWIHFLHGIFERENPQETEEIIDCMQMCLGYSLSGKTSEQCMFLLYGNGSNGKSTFSEQIAHVLGDYGDTVNSEILMQQKVSQNSSFTIAKLKDARFVETGETDEGGKLAEGTVKRLTGSDKLSAAFKYANEFSFVPKFKIWMSTNNKPIIRGTDFGIWRRIFLFPFLKIFTGKEKDRSMPQKLKDESDKILGWMIKGFLKYQEVGEIVKPKCIEDEVKEYQQQMDVAAQFIKDQCIPEEGTIVLCDVLYKNYKLWAMDNSEFILKQSKFSSEVIAKGYQQILRGNKRYYSGLRLLNDKTSGGYDYA